MKSLVRKNELPRFTSKDATGLYPGYAIVGTPHGWHYPIHATKTVIIEYSFQELFRLVKAHLKGNDIPEPVDLVREMQEHACQFNPEFCEETDPDKQRKITLWYRAKKFYEAVTSAMRDGLVPQEEAERRAAICAECPHNRGEEVSFCVGCWSAKFVKDAAEALSTRRTSLDHKLDTCSLCSCSLKMKVHVRKEAMQDKQITWPANCWMKD